MDIAYKFRIYPTKAQEQQIQKTFGCTRFVFNYFLASRQAAYKERGESLNYYDCANALTLLKKDLPWLCDVDSTALQSCLRDLDNAYKNFFRGMKEGRKVGYPRFKRKHSRHKSYKSKCVGNTIAVVGSKLPYKHIAYRCDAVYRSSVLTLEEDKHLVFYLKTLKGQLGTAVLIFRRRHEFVEIFLKVYLH